MNIQIGDKYFDVSTKTVKNKKTTQLLVVPILVPCKTNPKNADNEFVIDINQPTKNKPSQMLALEFLIRLAPTNLGKIVLLYNQVSNKQITIKFVNKKHAISFITQNITELQKFVNVIKDDITSLDSGLYSYMNLLKINQLFANEGNFQNKTVLDTIIEEALYHLALATQSDVLSTNAQLATEFSKVFQSTKYDDRCRKAMTKQDGNNTLMEGVSKVKQTLKMFLTESDGENSNYFFTFEELLDKKQMIVPTLILKKCVALVHIINVAIIRLIKHRLYQYFELNFDKFEPRKLQNAQVLTLGLVESFKLNYSSFSKKNHLKSRYRRKHQGKKLMNKKTDDEQVSNSTSKITRPTMDKTHENYKNFILEKHNKMICAIGNRYRDNKDYADSSSEDGSNYDDSDDRSPFEIEMERLTKDYNVDQSTDELIIPLSWIPEWLKEQRWFNPRNYVHNKQEHRNFVNQAKRNLGYECTSQCDSSSDCASSNVSQLTKLGYALADFHEKMEDLTEDYNWDRDYNCLKYQEYEIPEWLRVLPWFNIRNYVQRNSDDYLNFVRQALESLGYNDNSDTSKSSDNDGDDYNYDYETDEHSSNDDYGSENGYMNTSSNSDYESSTS